MRAMLVLVVVLMGCVERPCAETCRGCCDPSGECRPGTTQTYCGVEGRTCDDCKDKQICSPTGACVSSGAGGGTGGGSTGGGGGASGGGGGVASVFVTLRFDHAVEHLDGSCLLHTAQTCVVTKSVPVTRFQDLRTGTLSSCTVTQTSSDGFDANCSGKCVMSDPGCTKANGVARRDERLTCPQFAGATSLPACDWTP